MSERFQKLFENPEVNILKTLLDSMASPALRNENGPQWTPLHAAALQEEGKACMLLMEGRANPLEKDTEGISAEKSTRFNMFQCSRMFHVGNTTFSLFHFSIPVAFCFVLLCVGGGFLFLILYPAPPPAPTAASLSHTILSHTIFHTQLYHTTLHIQLFQLLDPPPPPLSFLPFPSGYNFFSAYWKKLTCGVIRSFCFYLQYLLYVC